MFLLILCPWSGEGMLTYFIFTVTTSLNICFWLQKLRLKILSLKNLFRRYFVISNALTWVVLILKSGTFSMINCVQGPSLG